MCSWHQRVAVLHQSLTVFRNEAEMFWRERYHLELIGTSCLSSAEHGTLRRSAQSCSRRCSSATERTPSRPCTAPAWPKSTWPVSSEPRWAVSRRILLSIIGRQEFHWMKFFLIYLESRVCIPEMVNCQRKPSENVQAFDKLSRCFFIEDKSDPVFNCQK